MMTHNSHRSHQPKVVWRARKKRLRQHVHAVPKFFGLRDYLMVLAISIAALMVGFAMGGIALHLPAPPFMFEEGFAAFSPPPRQMIDKPQPTATMPPVSFQLAVPSVPKSPAAVAKQQPHVASLPIKPPPPLPPVVIKPGKRPRVVIIIDDMGMDIRRSKQVVQLSTPLTLSYLPYAPNVAQQTRHAKRMGHELIMHIPMEPQDSSWNLGPRPLLVADRGHVFQSNLEWSLSQFDDYVAINNHMGSKLTTHEPSLRRIMYTLKQRGIMFVDSRTSPNSRALAIAQEMGVPSLGRDVFLDHVDDVDYVRNQLKILTRTAHKRGHAIAIGHPRDATIKALNEWLNEHNRSVDVVPLTALIQPKQPGTKWVKQSRTE